ncbi:MAG: MATE family efflux transporter [Clostridia bacterium]|nr:MATE family efflux transporter [Clostridia bacterium]
MEREMTEIERKYRMSGRISLSKLIEYLPATLLTSFSSLLLQSVDGIVVGNFVSDDALSSVSIFSPVAFIAGIVSVLVANGISTCLSVAAGENDRKKIGRIKAASRVLMAVAAIAIVVLQTAGATIIISTYGLPENMRQMVWQYAIGMILSAPFGFISTVGVYQLQVIGKMKLLARLAVMEGVLNLVLDVVFVKFLGMGTAGVGFGTAGATITRCVVTMVVVMRSTDLFKIGDIRPEISAMKEILRTGLPNAANVAMQTLQSYLMIMILIRGFGPDAGIVLAVCSFCYSLYGVLSAGVTGSMRPLVGLMTGAEDVVGLKLLIRQGMAVMELLVALLAGAIVIVPHVFYRIYNVSAIPDGGVTALRIYAVYFLVSGVNEVLRLFMVNQKDTGFASAMPAVRTAVRLSSAWLFGVFLPAPFIWLAYPLGEGLECLLNAARYRRLTRAKADDGDDARILYLSVRPSEAVDASRMLRSYADDKGYPKKISYRIGLAMEEIVAYAKQAHEGAEVETQIVVRLARDRGVFLVIDNGIKIVLDEDAEKAELVTDNYNLLRKLANSMEHQYLLNMNLTKLEFLAA